MTKQFTAAAILQLVEAGRLSPDDKLGQHYANAPPAWTDVTIKQLLNHSAGVPNWNNPEMLVALRGRSPEAAVSLVRDKPLDFPAGTSFAYSNTGYILLGMIMERVAEQSYTAYLRDHIFTPLGMADTGYDVNSDLLPRRASGYNFDDRGFQNASFVPMTLFFAGGGLYSTVDDLQRWEEGLQAGRVINATSLAAMFADYGHGYGYGQFVGRLNNRRAVWHGGGIPGFASNLVHYPDSGVTVIALSNMQNTHIEKLTAELAGIAFAEWKPPPEIALAPRELEPLVGAYLYNPTLVLRVRLENGRLTAQFTENGKFEISSSAPLSFFSRAVDAKFEFDPSVDGKSRRVAHSQRGNRKVCERIPDAQADEIEKLVYARRDAAEGRQGRSFK
jgi:CubicO group peptidase (beta-lactamase class C family)